MFKGDRNFTVGLFVTIAIAVFVTFVVWLTGRTGVEEMKRYSLLFDSDVSGLAIGGPVKYMGMNIGSVTRMTLEKSEDIRVRVDIDVLESTPVDNGTYASLTLQGITGVAVVNLQTEPGRHSPLTPLAGQEYPVIPVRVVGFSALLSSAPEIMAKLNSLLTQAGEMLGEENSSSITATLKNVENLTASLADNRDTIAALPNEIHGTLAEIQLAVSQLRTVMDELKPGLDGTVENLQTSTDNLASMTARVDRLVHEHEDDIGRFMEDGLAEIPAIMQDARSTLREIEKLVQKLQQDPSQLIHRRDQSQVEIDP
mgnify:CR=1 FL=1|jgi:phospholipid/cholesterol/gamma-HCH transport system substrate-binding protein